MEKKTSIVQIDRKQELSKNYQRKRVKTISYKYIDKT